MLLQSLTAGAGLVTGTDMVHLEGGGSSRLAPHNREEP